MRLRDGKKLAHDGIKVEFIGSIGEFIVLKSHSSIVCSFTHHLQL